jgi:hypothetical protein
MGTAREMALLAEAQMDVVARASAAAKRATATTTGTIAAADNVA